MTPLPGTSLGEGASGFSGPDVPSIPLTPELVDAIAYLRRWVYGEPSPGPGMTLEGQVAFDLGWGQSAARQLLAALDRALL